MPDPTRSGGIATEVFPDGCAQFKNVGAGCGIAGGKEMKWRQMVAIVPSSVIYMPSSFPLDDFSFVKQYTLVSPASTIIARI